MEFFVDVFNAFADSLMKLLPVSPFQRYLDMFSDIPYLGILNWFIPIGTFVRIGFAWLSVISVFYLYSVVMRWLKIIGD